MRIHALPIFVAAICILAIAYRFYSAFIAAKVFALDGKNQAPAHARRDGKDYVPTSRWVLFGHHFAAITGAGPLIGPVLAAQFGFLPGLLWILIGVTLASHDLQGQWRGAIGISLLKLLGLPALVLVTAHWGFGLSGLPLSVVVLMAALPAGSNALIFSQRYGTLQAETTAANVISTFGFVATASTWLLALTWLA